MKYILLACAGLVMWSACDDQSRRSAQVPDYRGRWSFTLAQSEPAGDTYTVEVSKAGGSGVAEITAASLEGDTSGPRVVVADLPVRIGDCGLAITFSDTAGRPLNLALGDRWLVQVSAGVVYNPAPAPANSSTVDSVTTGGIYTCLPAPCPGGLFGAMAPPAEAPLPFGPLIAGSQGEIPLVQMEQTGSNLSAVIPEEHVLTLALPGAAVGDSISISYSRSVNWADPNGDFFLVQAVNGAEMNTLEFVSSESPGRTLDRRRLTFRANSVNLTIDFIFGLSGPENVVLLDRIQVLKNGTPWFQDDFVGPNFSNDLAPLAQRWQVRSPAQAQGSVGISDATPLQGTYSVRAEGGAVWNLQGAILTGAGLLGLNLAGFDTQQAVEGVTLEVFETEVFNFLTSLAGLEQGRGALAGTFRGEASDHSCLEQGTFLSSLNASGLAEVEGRWTLHLEGEAQACLSAVEFGDTLGPFQVTQTGRTFYADPQTPIVDKYGNPSHLFGTVNGPAVVFFLGDFQRVSVRRATLAGVAAGNTVAGALFGILPFARGEECEVTGTFTVTLER